MNQKNEKDIAPIPEQETNSKKGRAKRFFKKLILLFLNPRFLLCFGIAWLITNGWSYI